MARPLAQSNLIFCLYKSTLLLSLQYRVTDYHIYDHTHNVMSCLLQLSSLTLCYAFLMNIVVGVLRKKKMKLELDIVTTLELQ